jgi:hypothetical protein
VRDWPAARSVASRCSLQAAVADWPCGGSTPRLVRPGDEIAVCPPQTAAVTEHPSTAQLCAVNARGRFFPTPVGSPGSRMQQEAVGPRSPAHGSNPSLPPAAHKRAPARRAKRQIPAWPSRRWHHRIRRAVGVGAADPPDEARLPHRRNGCWPCYGRCCRGARLSWSDLASTSVLVSSDIRQTASPNTCRFMTTPRYQQATCRNFTARAALAVTPQFALSRFQRLCVFPADVVATVPGRLADHDPSAGHAWRSRWALTLDRASYTAAWQACGEPDGNGADRRRLQWATRWTARKETCCVRRCCACDARPASSGRRVAGLESRASTPSGQ